MDVLEGANRLLLGVEQDLALHCGSLDSPEAEAKCQVASEFLRQKHLIAESACRWEIDETGQPGSACHELDRLRRTVYDTSCAGGSSSLITVLAAQKKMEGREPEGGQANILARRAKASTLFDQIDSDGNGRLDKSEFLDAMEELHAHFSAPELHIITTCMDIQGFIPRSQFLDIAADSHPDKALLFLTACQLFSRIDADGDGKLDRQEFEQALHLLDKELPRQDVELIGRCLDLQGYVPLDQFLDVVTDRQPGEVLLRHKARELFDKMDRNKNGLLDREELMLAMNQLHEHLDQHELGLVLSCMDLNSGFVPKDQFLEIVSAEQLRSDPGADAQVLSRMARARPSWWTECPASIENV